jgi:hypothetical protein
MQSAEDRYSIEVTGTFQDPIKIERIDTFDKQMGGALDHSTINSRCIKCGVLQVIVTFLISSDKMLETPFVGCYTLPEAGCEHVKPFSTYN